MKYIVAVIRPEKLEAVRTALEQAGCSGVMISEIEGHGKQKGIVQQWRGERYKLDLLPKIKLEIITRGKAIGSATIGFDFRNLEKCACLA